MYIDLKKKYKPNKKVYTPFGPLGDFKMKVRKSKVGNQFWGCTRFPQCKGTRNLH